VAGDAYGNIVMTVTGVEVITSGQRRWRWSAEEKARIVQETYALGCRCR
jgi:hypothetical protein